MILSKEVCTELIVPLGCLEDDLKNDCVLFSPGLCSTVNRPNEATWVQRLYI